MVTGRHYLLCAAPIILEPTTSHPLPTQGFAERKVLLACDAIAVCKKLHNEEVRKERLAALKSSRQASPGSP